MTSSALYRGTVRHQRLRGDAAADFTHPLTLLYADLDELPGLVGGRLVRRWPGLVRLRARDLHGRTGDWNALKAAVRRTVAERTGRPAPEGRITVLTHPRIAGVSFNPVSFYYLHDAAGELDTVLAEVTSTPWRERRAYVLRAPDATGGGEPAATDPPAHRTQRGGLAGEHRKAMRVSPFQPMEQRYSWIVSEPGQRLGVRIENHAAATDAVEIAATLDLTREPLTPASLRAMLRRHPAGTLRVLALIYGHAIALKARGAAIHPRHPITGEGGRA